MRTKDMNKLMDAYNQVILGESLEIDEARQFKDPKKDSMVSKKGKTIVIDKSKEKEYLKKGWELAEKKTLDPVDDKANDKKFKDRKDKDIDNDGDVDSSDEYLHKKRAATDDAIDGGKKPAKKEGNAFTQALKAAKDKGDDTFVVAGKKYDVTTKEEIEDEGDEPKKKKPFPPKKDGEEKDDEDKGEEESDDEEEKDVPKVVGKKDDKKKVASNAKTAEISKIGEDIDLTDATTDLLKMWESAAKKSVKGATDKGEEIDSKQSPKSKEFDNSHDKSEKDVEDNVEDAKKKSKGAEGGTKANSGKRPVDNAAGDKNVVKSTEVKEDTSEEIVAQAQDIINGKTVSEIADMQADKPKNPHDARTKDAKKFLERMAKRRGYVKAEKGDC